MTTRRTFLSRSLLALPGVAVAGNVVLAADSATPDGGTVVPTAVVPQSFRISLAQWSFHRALQAGKLKHMHFAEMAMDEFGIDAVEYVNSFFKDKAKDRDYLAEMKKRAADRGVRSLLIMCDGEGQLGDANESKRQQAVENHYRWVEAAKFLGCHSIRVNAASSGSYEDQLALAADGLRRLTEFGAEQGIGVIVENHGGLSSNGAWLSAVMKRVDHPNCGTLPDFGNFNLGGGQSYDRYQGVTELMPFAKAVSAKSNEFDDQGNEIHTDYFRMIPLVLSANYKGYIGIEYEGGKHSEYHGVLLTLNLLERVRRRLQRTS